MGFLLFVRLVVGQAADSTASIGYGLPQMTLRRPQTGADDGLMDRMDTRRASERCSALQVEWMTGYAMRRDSRVVLDSEQSPHAARRSRD